MNWGVRIKFTIFAIASLMIMVVVYNTMMNRVVGESTVYTADFTSVSGLRAGDDVRAAGVRVGRVEKIGLTGGDTARIEFTLGAGQRLTDTTTISVRYQNLLGQRYLALTRGEEAGAELDPDDVVGTEQTDPGFDLTALLNGFEPLFDTLEPAAINELAGSLVQVLQGEGGTVEALLEQTAALTENLAAKDAVITDVLTNLTPVLQDFTAQEAEFTNTVDRLSDLMTGLAAEREAIVGSLDGMSELAVAAESLTTELRPDIVTTVSSLRGVVEMMVGHQDAIDQLLSNGARGFDPFTRPTNTGTWLNMFICLISVEAIPGAPIAISVGPPSFSAVCS